MLGKFRLMVHSLGGSAALVGSDGPDTFVTRSGSTSHAMGRRHVYMAAPRTHVLPLPLATSITFSLFSALINLLALASSGGGRVRDLRIIRLARRVADHLDWNLLASVPPWVH